MQSHPSAPHQGLYPQAQPAQGIAPVSGYAPPPQVAPGATAPPPPAQGYAPPAQGYAAPPAQGYAPPAQGYAPPAQGYAPPAQEYAPQATAPPPTQGYPQPGYTAPPAGYAQPVVAPGQQPPTAQGMGQAFDSVVGKVKKITIGGPSQPKSSIDAFKDGNTISLKSKVSDYLRILADGRVDCRGPNGKDAISQFTVKVISPNVVSLHSANNPAHYLSICQGVLNGTGQGGTLCHFTLVEAPDKEVSLTSVGEPGHTVGVTQEGSVADPKHVLPGHHYAQFTAIVVKEGIPTVAPSSTGPAPGLPVTFALKQGNVIQLISKMSGRPLIIAKNGILSGSGDYGEQSELLVFEKSPGILMLRSAPIKSFYLCIFKNEFEGRGQGGPHCDVRVHPTPDNYIAFESVKTPGQFFGVSHNGAIARADKLSLGHLDTQFRIRIVRMAPITEQLPVLLRYDGQPSVLNNLKDGTSVQLVSRSYGDTLEIKENGMLGTKGGSLQNSDLIVRSRGGNIVSFQAKKHPGYVMCIQGGAVKGKQGTGLQVDFVVHETYDRHVLLESLANQGQFVAVTPTGELKNPSKTNIQDPDCQFYVK